MDVGTEQGEWVDCRDQAAELQLGSIYRHGKKGRLAQDRAKCGEQPLRRVAWAQAWAPQWYFEVTLELWVLVSMAVVLGEVW